MSWFERGGKVWIDGIELNESLADLSAIVIAAPSESAAESQLFGLVTAQMQGGNRRRRAHFNITNKASGQFRLRIQATALPPPDWAAIDLFSANIAAKMS